MKRTMLALAVACAALAVNAQEPASSGDARAQDPWAPATFADFRLRAIGPALMSGRISHIAIHPESKQTWYIGVASGGVWKTTNAGITFTPVFQNEGSYSIGTVVVDQKHPATIWVGTGEANNQRSVGYGDGIYRSDDAGRTWRNLGLKTSEHVGRIVIDPRDSNVVFAAAYGPLWSAGGERGLYKTTDGGANWSRVLEISENTGISDVAIDPANPDVMLAVAHQRRRHTWTLIHGGPGKRPAQVDGRRQDLAANPCRPPERGRRPHRDHVFSRSKGARLREGGVLWTAGGALCVARLR